jgi:hypothetical protein
MWIFRKPPAYRNLFGEWARRQAAGSLPEHPEGNRRTHFAAHRYVA